MEWRPINKYEGYYEVSNTGLVRSVDRYVGGIKPGSKRLLHGRIMKQTESRSLVRGGQGYMVVNLRNNGSTVCQVHRLVAEAFIPNPNKLPVVNHKDGNKHNNNVSNLEWSSYSYNNIHAIRTGLRKPRGNAVGQYKEGNPIATYKSVCEASRITGIGRSSISHCINGMQRQAGGYEWKNLERCNDYPDGSTAEDELPLEVQERREPKI